MKRHISILLASMFTCMLVHAVPAIREPLTITDASGKKITVYLRGDENFHQYFTEDGYPLIERDGNFYYSDIDSRGKVTDSGIKATPLSGRTLAAQDFLRKIDRDALEGRIKMLADVKGRKKLPYRSDAIASPRRVQSNDGPPFAKGYGLFPGTAFPAYGNQKAIVILVEYKDVKFNSSYDAKDYFTRMLNEEGFSDLGATGSAAQYFRENSMGAFAPEFDVYGPITLSQNRAYYGGNDRYGDDQNPADMVKEACDQLDATVNFQDYDRDGDGVVDNIFIFYAGQGEASGGPAESVWPHSWDMYSAGYRNLKYDGVQILTYGCTNEWVNSGRNGRPDGVGTFIHEFSHVMGLPDLYATNYSTAYTPGEWSVLDYGPYNNNGMTPPNYGAFERYALGWIDPVPLTEPMSPILQDISYNQCGIIPTTKATEFFLVENRQQTGWDTYIPGHGMLVWHIDYNSSIWNQNTVNNLSSHQYVDIEEADNIQSEKTASGDAFPGQNKQYTSFTSSTNPAMKTWAGKALDYPITNIDENDGLISFDVLGGAVIGIDQYQMIATEATGIEETAFVANWEEMEGATGYYLTVYKGEKKTVDPEEEEAGVDDEENSGEEEDEGDEDSEEIAMLSEECLIEGLEPLEQYNMLDVGNVLSYVVTGLDQNTVYYYVVTATDGNLYSIASEPVEVMTLLVTGVSAPVMQGTPDVYYTIDGLRLNGAPTRPGIYILNGRKVVIKN